MLQSMRSQRAEHNLAAEQQQCFMDNFLRTVKLLTCPFYVSIPLYFLSQTFLFLAKQFASSFVYSFQRGFLFNCWIIKPVYLYVTLHESLEEMHYVSVTVHFKTLKTGKNSRQFHSQSWPDPPSLQLHRGPLCPPYVCSTSLFSVLQADLSYFKTFVCDSQHLEGFIFASLPLGSVSVHAKLLQSCPTLCNPMDYSLPASSVRGILQVRILKWIAISFPGDLPNPGIEPRSPALQADSLPTEL